MRVMVMVKATKNSEAGILPGDPKAPAGYDNLFEEMGKFNEQLVKAGVMLEGDGLRPSSKGKRVRFSSGRRPSLTALSPRPRSSSPATGSGR